MRMLLNWLADAPNLTCQICWSLNIPSQRPRQAQASGHLAAGPLDAWSGHTGRWTSSRLFQGIISLYVNNVPHDIKFAASVRPRRGALRLVQTTEVAQKHLPTCRPREPYRRLPTQPGWARRDAPSVDSQPVKLCPSEHKIKRPADIASTGSCASFRPDCPLPSIVAAPNRYRARPATGR